MGRILALDYGHKRVGIAVTDPNQIIASALETVEAQHIFSYLKTYLETQKVDKIVLGHPLDLKGGKSNTTIMVEEFKTKLKSITSLPVILYDERFSSKMAEFTIQSSGLKKSKRQEKSNIDKISACIILQGYLNSNHNRLNL